MMNIEKSDKLLRKQKLEERVFVSASILAIAVTFAVLLALLINIFTDGFSRLSWSFITSFPSRKAENAGLYSAFIGSLYLITLTSVIAIPIGVGAAVYLEEYAKKNRFNRLIEINVLNLAGIPSIIYGILGLELFVRMMNLGRGLLAGALTMALLVLPIVIVSTREAIRVVPNSVREAAFAIGASRWRVVKDHVLPLSFPGICTGIILSISRAIGETAPLIMIGALTYVAFLPDSINAPFTAIPIQIFNWVSRPQKGFHVNAAAGIIVLLLVTLSLNAMAIFLRNHYQKKMSVRSL